MNMRFITSPNLNANPTPQVYVAANGEVTVPANQTTGIATADGLDFLTDENGNVLATEQ
jgi:hypothetical protein